MTYAGHRRILDADAHIMEPPGWLESFVADDVRDQLAPLDFGDPEFVSKIESSVAAVERRRTDTTEAEVAAREFLSMPRKGWGALGDHDAAERRQVLDLLGFDAQIVYPTGSFPQAVTSPDAVRVAAIEGMNRGMAAFADTDRRMLGVAYVPFHFGADVAVRLIERAIADGCAVAMVDAVPPHDGQAPSHPDFDRVWDAFTANDMPVSLHVGLDNGWRPVRPSFFDNGLDLPNLRTDAPGDALSYMGIGFGAQLFVASLIFDGVFHRHPALRLMIAELGGTWVPGFLHFLDTSYRSFRRLQNLSHLDDDPASSVARRHVVVSPFAGEHVGYMLDQAGPEMFVFASDYPHHEGSSDPIDRFERTMVDASDAERAAFFAGNLERFLGPRLLASVGAV